MEMGDENSEMMNLDLNLTLSSSPDTYRSTPTAELANITQRLIESYTRYSNLEKSLDQPLPVEDIDSVSSIAAVIHSESQVDIDYMVSLSTSSSSRRVDGSRVADVDSRDSRAPRRRRLN